MATTRTTRSRRRTSRRHAWSMGQIGLLVGILVGLWAQTHVTGSVPVRVVTTGLVALGAYVLVVQAWEGVVKVWKQL